MLDTKISDTIFHATPAFILAPTLYKNFYENNEMANFQWVIGIIFEL